MQRKSKVEGELNVKKRGLSIGLVLCLLVGMLSIVALAEGNEQGTLVNLDLSNGSIIITSNGYTVGDSTTETAYTGGYAVEQANTETTNNTIVIESGNIDMTIRGLNVEATNTPAIWVKAGATLNLTVEGDNALTGGSYANADGIGGFAAICVEPAYDVDWNYDAEACGALYLSGSGSLMATGGAGDMIGGTYGGGAGLGGNGEDQFGGASVDFGLVCITENFTGLLTATGGAGSAYIDGANAFGGGAGIGGGGFNMGYINNYEDVSPYYWGEVAGRIEIHGGSITATSNGNGAGIGGGGGQGEDSASSQITINITDGNITTTGGARGAGIGGGALCDGGYITVSGGAVAAHAGTNEDSMGAAGLGGGNDASVSSVIISNGAQITAIASGGAAGIGGGTNTSYSNVHYGDMNGDVSASRVGKISISGEGTVVSAHGGTGVGYSGSKYGGAGIGSGYPVANNARSVAFDISITDGASVRAYGGYHAQAIGYGYRPTDYIGYGITLTLDDTIFLWAQNADYYQPALVAVTEYNSTPVSYSSDNKIYLTHYVDVDREAESAHASTVPGYLNQPSDVEDETFDWVFDESNSTVSVGPVTVVDKVVGLNGNWATLCTVVTPSPSPEVTPSPSPEVTPSPSPEVTPSPSPEVTPSPSPEVTPSPSPEVTPSPSPEVTPSPSPEVTPSQSPEVTPSPSPEVTPSLPPVVTPTLPPVVTPSPSPEVTPNPSPEVTPSPSPEVTPSPSPEVTPSSSPETTPSPSPVVTPDPGSPNTPDDTPQTNDTSGLGFWLTATLCSLIAFLAALVGKKVISKKYK
jgi:hypothetical protein